MFHNQLQTFWPEAIDGTKFTLKWISTHLDRVGVRNFHVVCCCRDKINHHRRLGESRKPVHVTDFPRHMIGRMMTTWSTTPINRPLELEDQWNSILLICMSKCRGHQMFSVFCRILMCWRRWRVFCNRDGIKAFKIINYIFGADTAWVQNIIVVRNDEAKSVLAGRARVKSNRK